MKLSPLEEYGLRLLLQMATEGDAASLTISDISDTQGLSVHNVAKIMRLLRKADIVVSARGQSGGYRLARAPEDIVLGNVLAVLGGRMIDSDFCAKYSSDSHFCSSDACTVRAFWGSLQSIIDKIVYSTTVADLLRVQKDGPLALHHAGETLAVRNAKAIARTEAGIEAEEAYGEVT